MLKKLLLALGTIGLLTTAASPVSAMPAPASLTTFAAQCPATFITLPAWYRGLKGAEECNPQLDSLNNLWTIGLNIIEMMLHIVVYVASGYTLWAGFRYMLANGEPDKISSAKNTITHALTGLVIAIVSIAAINFIVGFTV